MKKFFTLLSTAAFAVALNAQESQTLSQTEDEIFVESVSASACMDFVNAYFRLFDLNDYAITGDFTVTGVDAAAIIWNGGYGEVSVWTFDGEEADDIDVSLFEDTGLYGIYQNNTGERIWDWVSFDILDPSAAPLTSDKKFAVVVTHNVSNEGAAWADSYWPLYTNGNETKSAYFGGPTTGCYANQEGYASRYSSFVEGGKRAILLTVTGTVEGMGTVELNSKAVSVYPNPAKDVINVSLEKGEVESVEIVNLAGQSVYSAKAAGSLNVSFLPAGVYVVRVKDNNGTTHMSKIVKK